MNVGTSERRLRVPQNWEDPNPDTHRHPQGRILLTGLLYPGPWVPAERPAQNSTFSILRTSPDARHLSRTLRLPQTLRARSVPAQRAKELCLQLLGRAQCPDAGLELRHHGTHSHDSDCPAWKGDRRPSFIKQSRWARPCAKRYVPDVTEPSQPPTKASGMVSWGKLRLRDLTRTHRWQVMETRLGLGSQDDGAQTRFCGTQPPGCPMDPASW